MRTERRLGESGKLWNGYFCENSPKEKSERTNGYKRWLSPSTQRTMKVRNREWKWRWRWRIKRGKRGMAARAGRGGRNGRARRMRDPAMASPGSIMMGASALQRPVTDWTGLDGSSKKASLELDLAPKTSGDESTIAGLAVSIQFGHHLFLSHIVLGGVTSGKTPGFRPVDCRMPDAQHAVY